MWSAWAAAGDTGTSAGTDPRAATEAAATEAAATHSAAKASATHPTSTSSAAARICIVHKNHGANRRCNDRNAQPL
jgi:hypothetical protein